MRLDNVNGEYDNTVRELQWDITQLQQQLQERVQLSQESDKDRCQIIRELTQQNERLTEQLRKVGHMLRPSLKIHLLLETPPNFPKTFSYLYSFCYALD